VFDLPGNILILTGTPGAGKSATARDLIAASAAPSVHLHSDDFWHFIKKGAIPPYLPESQQQNEVVMGVLAQAAEASAKGDYFVIVDGSSDPGSLIDSKGQACLFITSCFAQHVTPPLNGVAVGAAMHSPIQKE